MANKSLFASNAQANRTDTRNEAGGRAFKMTDKQALAQLAVTGTLNDVFYMDAVTQLDDILLAAQCVEPEFLAKTAVYARQNGHMKDTPALLLAVLATVSPEYLIRAFPKIVDNGRMLRNFVQIMRSGTTGRKSLGSRPKKLVQGWLNSASDEMLVRAMVGKSPSLADVIKMVHPKPSENARDAFFAWLIDKPADFELLPKKVQDLVRFRENAKGRALPEVPFQLLTNLDLTVKQWQKLALGGGWHMLRMNLNTFLRHDVFGDVNVTRQIANRLMEPEAIRRARVFPYQLMATWMHMHEDMPRVIVDAVGEAMEMAIANVPQLPGNIVVCPDVSGSMTMPVTGYRKGATSKVSCMDVAALVAAAILRKNPSSRVMPFDTAVRNAKILPDARVVENAKKLARFCGGGTDCSAPLVQLNRDKARPDMVILVSDNESWADRYSGSTTGVMFEWNKLKKRVPNAKLVCLDIAPYATTQARERKDIMNIGGFSDKVFDLIAAFAKDELDPNRWVGEIEKIEL